MYSESNRVLKSDDILILENSFDTTLNYLNIILGKFAFKTYDKSLKNAKFNAALFDAQMVAMYELNPDLNIIERIDQTDFINLNHYLISEEDFSKLISSGTTDRNSIINRINVYKAFLIKNL